MAERYFVAGGDGNWGSTNNWAATKTGSAGETVPGASDNVYLTDVSPASLTVNASGRSCLSLDCTGYTGTLTMTLGITAYGNIVFSSAMTIGGTANLSWYPTSGTFSLNTGGKTLPGGLAIGPNGASTAVFNLASNVTATGNIVHQSGTLNTNNFSTTSVQFTSTGTRTRALNLGTSTINCTTTFSMSDPTGLTFDCGKSLISKTGSGTFAGGGQTFYNVIFTGITHTISGNNTFNSITGSADSAVKITSGTTQIIKENIYSLGTSGHLFTLSSSTGGNAGTISKTNGVVNLDYVSLQDSVASGGAKFFAGANSTSVSGNTGWIFQGADSINLDQYNIGIPRNTRYSQFRYSDTIR